jgi:predicted transcriptional regulator
MRSRLAPVIAIVSIIILGVAGATAFATSQRHAPPNKAGSAKAETYDVVKIGDDVKVIKKSELAGLKKSTADEDKRLLKEYQDSKKGTGKSKDASGTVKKPVKRSVLVLKASLKTDQEAQDWLTKYLKDKKGGSKTAKGASNW